MAKRADEAKATAQVENSERKRTTTGVRRTTAGMVQKRATLARKTHHHLNAKTVSRAAAKAGKPGDGKKVERWKTGPNGGEDQTTNGVAGTGRGADGPAVVARTSRKSTRNSGEKESQLTRRTKRAIAAPKSRATRDQARH